MNQGFCSIAGTFCVTLRNCHQRTMNQNLKPNERELIKLVNFFKKRAEKMISEGKADESQQEMIKACEKLIEKIHNLAANRADILVHREQLTKIVKDNAECPKCNRNTHLKSSGVFTDDKGLKFNKYTCRRCNIQFVWSRPNNPWDLVAFMESYIESLSTSEDPANIALVDQMKENVAKLKPVLLASDNDYEEMRNAEVEMDKMIHGFKNHLLIEKIKMDTWEEPINPGNEG